MQFRSLNATFGKLEHRALTLCPGLNIIEAPNEAGKSTLCAFLRVMLYGLPTRERGALADKNLYAPWSGSAMQGRLELVTDDGADITLTRDTARANAPMGRFSAVYTGTGEPVAALTAECGEQLLGIPREVYERSAFIRQSGLAVSADAELERRIAALITTGEETTSFSEAEAVLRRQLNARRHNKTGRIPAADAEIVALESAAAELRALTAEHREAEAALAEQTARAESLRADLSRHELADAQERQKARADAERAAQLAEAQSVQFAALLREEKLPPRETLTLLRSKLPSIRALEQRARESAQRSAEARAALDAFDAGAQAGSGTSLYIVATALFAAALALWLAPFSEGSLRYAAPLLSITASVFFAVKGRQAQRKRKARADARSSLERTAQEANAAADAQQKLYEDAVQEILAALPIDALAQADRYLDAALARRDRLAALESDARIACARRDALAAQGEAPDVPTEPVERPAGSRSALQSALADCEAAAREAQRRIDYTAGRSRALGDLADTESALAEKRAEREALQDEYDAIALAMDALTQANTAIQSRFSPALGRRAAELFGRMTNGAYSAVLLDRSFNASAEAVGDPIARSVLSLSQGAADQLYLAVRLAICELVLPADRSIPLVLDDALTNFDDARCAAALELLLEESKTRQILLLTCQHREAEYLAGREGVHVMTL